MPGEGDVKIIEASRAPRPGGAGIAASQSTEAWVRRGTALSGLFPRKLPQKMGPRAVRLGVEGALAAIVSLVLASGAGGAQGAVIAIFLSAAGLVHRFDGLLEENRNAMWGGKSRGQNLRTALSLLATFGGVFVVYAVAVLALPTRAEAAVAMLADVAHIGHDTILTRRFGSFLGLFTYNAGVLLTFCVVSMVYRSLGALLALSWNAALWAIVLGVLVRRATPGTVMSQGLFVGVAWLAVLPHLLLEAAAYVTASLAAIFFSRAMLLYTWSDARLGIVAKASGRMLLLSVVLLGAAALAESTLPRVVLARLG